MAAIILAAGRSTRMGQSKPLLRYGGLPGPHLCRPGSSKSLKRQDFRRFSWLDARTTTAPGRGGPVRRHLYRESPGRPRPALVAPGGADRARDAGTVPRLEAVMVMPADAPLISSAAVDSAAARRRASQTPRSSARPTRGRHGHPVIFRRSTFAELHARGPGRRRARRCPRRSQRGSKTSMSKRRASRSTSTRPRNTDVTSAARHRPADRRRATASSPHLRRRARGCRVLPLAATDRSRAPARRAPSSRRRPGSSARSRGSRCPCRSGGGVRRESGRRRASRCR